MSTIAQSIRQSQPSVTDPRARRFGFLPGLKLAEMESSLSGQQERILPQGQVITFETATLKVDNPRINDLDWTPTEMKDFTAAFFAANVAKQFAPFGFVEFDMLMPLKDSEAKRRFNTVHASFELLGHTCPFGLIDTCATCRIQLLENDHYEDEINESLRLRLLQSYVTHADVCRNRWASITGELEDRKAGTGRGLPKLGEGEHHIRKNIHAVAPEERAAQTADAYGQASASATLQGMQAIAESLKSQTQPNPNADALLTVMETLRVQGEALAAIAQKINQPVVDADIELPLPKESRKKETK